MTATLLPEGKQSFSNGAGAPLVGGKVYTYDAGTNTPRTTYQDAAGTVPNTNPVILDARGEATIFWDGSYKVILKDAADVTIWTVDGAASPEPLGVLRADLISTVVGKGAYLIGWLLDVAGSVARTLFAKLKEIPSLLDFGAPSDGVASARSALNNACTNLTAAYGDNSLLISRGIYLIDADLTIPISSQLVFQRGAKLRISNGVTLTLNGVDIRAGRHQIFDCVGTGKVVGTVANDLIFPEWWGAIADGLGADFATRTTQSARNTPALKASLVFAGYKYPTNGLAGTVGLTYGYYVYNDTLPIPLSTNLIGNGIGSALFYYAPTGNAVDMYLTNNSLVSDIFIAPLAGATWNFTTGIGLRVDNVSTPCVRNVWCSGFGQADFYIKSSVEGRFYGLISDNTNGIAFDISGVGQGSIFENCVNAGSDSDVFYIHDGYDWTLIGCVAKSSTSLKGFYLNACENINLIGCSTHSIKQHGFDLTASTLNCNLTNCTANDPGISGSAYNGFNISGTRNKLTGCKTTANTPTYGYGLSFGGGATDCTSVNGNYTPGVLGEILDAQPTGNNTYSIQKRTTTNAVPVNIWAKSFNNNSTTLLEATVVANQRGATARAVYRFWALAKTDGVSTAIIAGPTSIYSYESNAALDATFVLTTATANAGVVSLQITGLAGLSIDWEATVQAMGVTG